MEASEILVEKLKKFEGLRLDAYKDAAGVMTIGYGQRLSGLVRRREWEAKRFFE